MRFTMNRIAALTCPEGRKDALFFDEELPGFGVRVTSTGSKTYLAQYRGATGVRRVSLGKHGVISLADARNAARAILGQVASGGDPIAERRAKDEAARQAQSEAAFTVEALIAAWVADRQESRRASYLKVAAAALRTHLAHLLTVPASAMTVRQAVAALDRVKAAAGPVAGNRLLAYARACFGWACKRQRLAMNPFAGLERPAREKSRDRVLTDAEIGAIWRAAALLDYPAGQFTRMLMLTLGRRDEVASMRWTEIAADGLTWSLPADRAKNGKSHVVHLSEPARGILSALPRFENSDFLFTTTGERPISGFSGFKLAIDRAIEADLGRGIADWRFHDFRRAGVTWLAGAGFPPHVADKLLNHMSGSIQGVAAVYQRAEFLPERERALDAWASHVISAAAGGTTAGNVIALRA